MGKRGFFCEVTALLNDERPGSLSNFDFFLHKCNLYVLPWCVQMLVQNWCRLFIKDVTRRLAPQFHNPNPSNPRLSYNNDSVTSLRSGLFSVPVPVPPPVLPCRRLVISPRGVSDEAAASAVKMKFSPHHATCWVGTEGHGH